MATRLFFHDAVNALSGTFPTDEQSTALASTKPVLNSGTLRTMNSITGTAMVARSLSGSATIATQVQFCAFFCSDTFDTDQPVGGGNQVITLNIANRESSTAMDLGEDLRTSVYVWRPSTGAVVGYVHDGGAMTGVAEAGAALSIRVNNGSVTSTTTVSAAAGDVLICEIWQQFAQASAVNPSGAIYYDGTTVTTTTNTVATNHASFLDFSVSTLTFGTPPVLSISCSFGQTLAPLTLSGTGNSPRNGSFGGSLAALTLAGVGAVPHTSTFNNTLDDVTLSGTGLVGVALGTFSNTLAALTLSGTGTSPRNGSFGGTLAALTLGGVGSIPLAGTSSKTLDDATLTGAGTANFGDATGTFSNTLGTLTLNGQGAVPIAGAASNTLGVATLSSTGRVPLAGTYSGTLGDDTLAATGTVTDIAPAVGSFLNTLENAQLAATGTVLSPARRVQQDPGAGSGASRARSRTKFRIPDTAVAPNPIDAILEPLPAPPQPKPSAPKVAPMSMVTYLTIAPTPLPPPPLTRPVVIEEDDYSDDDMIMLAMLV